MKLKDLLPFLYFQTAYIETKNSRQYRSNFENYEIDEMENVYGELMVISVSAMYDPYAIRIVLD